MTRDEVLEEAAQHLEQPAFPWVPHPMVAAPWAARVRALKSKPPEKSPEVEDGVEIWKQRIGALTFDLATTRAERDALRRQLPQYDCTHTGGPVSDSGGKHCPPESPCLTCRLERAERDRDFATAASGRVLSDLEATKAEISNLKWEQSGSPMKGE